MIDAHRMQQVIENLLDNSCQAMADPQWQSPALHERRITVRSETAGPHVRISVQDSGPGIAPDILSKVFDPLFTTKSFGTGLGLPKVRKFVELHGGTVDVESVAGQGTTFTIWLPRQTDVMPAREATRSESAA